MKLIKRISFQMFLLNLFAGIVCIAGMLILQYNLKDILNNYEQNIEGSVRDRLDMSDICRLMSRHHMIVSWHTLTDTAAAKQSYEKDASRLQEEITGLLEEMNGRISGSRKEQLFHTVYSNAISYFNNAENIFQMSRDGRSGTARYYITSYLADFISRITDDIDILDGYIVAEMDETNKKMDHSIAIAEISERICIICICAVTVLCMVLCVSITSRLEKYKICSKRKTPEKPRRLSSITVKFLHCRKIPLSAWQT